MARGSHFVSPVRTRGVAPLRSRRGRESGLRMAAATAATLLAIAGAQLVVPTSFALMLALVTLAGVPVSLWVRTRDLQFGRLGVQRVVWNSFIVIATLGATYYFLSDTVLEMWTAYQSAPQRFWLLFGGGASIILLVQMFLIFAAFRSFSILTDKDATLSTIPSFSVLLLLVPLHKGIEVVFYFVAWTLIAATLFALEHRSEQAASVVATVPGAVPGQDGRLAARSLVTTLVLSLGAAMGVSAWLASRDASEHSEAEAAITSLASRLTQFAFGSGGNSTSGGPERQIDFSGGPVLPTRAELWQTFAITLNGEVLQPRYYRLFTLSTYAENAWSQTPGVQKTVTRGQLERSNWPLPRPAPNLATSDPRIKRFRPELLITATDIPKGFAVDSAHEGTRRSFGPHTTWVQQRVRSLTPNLGFAPALPAPRSLVVRRNLQEQVRVMPDGGVDISIIQPGQVLRTISNVPRLEEYGFAGRRAPVKSVAPTSWTPKLSDKERRLNLQLPATVPARVGELAASVLRASGRGRSNFARASALAREIQTGSAYTLRPPGIPDGRDATDFFLFEGGRRGYCTYFAAALAVMCRTQGIPARLVSGFASPEYAPDGDAIIREANAHAWTEVWIENWGWAPVDATPAAERGDNSPTWAENWGDWFGAALDSFSRASETRWPLGFSLIAVLSVATLWRRGAFNRRPKREESAARGEMIHLYERATRRLTRGFRSRASWETPDEWRAAALAALPDAPREALERLTHFYVRARFDSRPLAGEELAQAHQAAREVARWKPRRTPRRPQTIA